MNTKRKIAELLAKWRRRCGRGDSLTSDIKGMIVAASTGGVIILLIEKYTGWLMPIWFLIVFYVVQKIAEYFIGWLDQKHLGFWRVESEWEQKHISPWEQKKMKLLEEINKKL